MHDQAPETGAALPGRAYRGEDGCSDGEIHVRRRAHDHCVVAAELEDRAPEPRAATVCPTTLPMAVDPVALMTGTRSSPTSAEPIARSPRMIELSPPQEPELARSGSRSSMTLLEDRLTGESAQRGFLRRLPDHGVAAHEC